MDKILRVNMTDLTSKLEAVPAEWAGLGGRGLTSTIVAAEVPPTCHALSAQNILCFAPGLLTGTPAANSGRLSAGAKSPLTGATGNMTPELITKVGHTELIGQAMFTKFLLPFEVTSILLLVAIVGSVILAKRKL